eukprot:sb/3476138/
MGAEAFFSKISSYDDYLEYHNTTLAEIFKMKMKDAKPFFDHCRRDLDRSFVSVKKKCIRMFDERNQLGAYTEDEISRLKALDLEVSSENRYVEIAHKSRKFAVEKTAMLITLAPEVRLT